MKKIIIITVLTLIAMPIISLASKATGIEVLPAVSVVPISLLVWALDKGR